MDDRVRDGLWFLAVALLGSIGCLQAGAQLGATFDEPFYIQKGLECWRYGSRHDLMRAGTMPLPVDVQTLPLHIWERLRGEAFEPIADLPKLLPIARGMNLVFWWLLLLYTHLLARQWGGMWAGRLAVGLIGFEPNLLAHAALATTDIALSAGVLAAIFHYEIGRDGVWWKRVLMPGVVAGLALSCKVSAGLYLPLAFLVLNVPSNLRIVLDQLSIVGLAVLMVFLLCGSNFQTEASFRVWADGLPDGAVADGVRFAARHLAIFPNAGEGFVQQFKHNLRGHGCFILGEWHPRAIWYYYPLLLSMKLPGTTMLALSGLLLFRRRALQSRACALAVAYLLFSLLCRVQIGVRLQFPLVLMLNLAVAVGLCQEPLSRWRQGLACLLVLVSLFTAAWWHPQGLQYRHRFWEEQFDGHSLFADSNSDWGQGLPELKAWHAEHGQPDLVVWYFGTDPAILVAPFRMMQVHEHASPSLADIRFKVGKGVFAVSHSMKHACPDRRPQTLAILAALESQTLVGRTRCFDLYTFE